MYRYIEPFNFNPPQVKAMEVGINFCSCKLQTKTVCYIEGGLKPNSIFQSTLELQSQRRCN